MSEINVTPMVDVMLVLLIVFMVAAPLLTVSIPVELPQALGGEAAKSLNVLQLIITGKKISGSCDSSAQFYLNETPFGLDELEAKIKAIKDAGQQELRKNIRVRIDRGSCYADAMKLLGRIRAAGFGVDLEIIPETGG
jgi:biopolymer transport protein ExbD/biopolymer transport protein TolR